MAVCKLKVLGSSSAGNCYMINSGKNSLLIEAGLPEKNVLKATNWEVGNVAALLCSHRATRRPCKVYPAVEQVFSDLLQSRCVRVLRTGQAAGGQTAL